MAIIKLKRTNRGIGYQVRVRDKDGNWFPSTVFDHLDQAQAEEASLNERKRKGARAISQDARTTSVDEYWEVWAFERRTETSEGWKISQDQMYRDYISPVIGRLMMSKVDAPAIGRVIARVKELGRGDQMRLHVYRLMRQSFGDAVEYFEMLDRNPVRAKFHRPKVTRREAGYLIPSESWRLLKAAREHRYLGPAVWLETLAAMRSEAVIALDWSQIQWSYRQIKIDRAWKQKVGRIEPYAKGRATDTVPMVPGLEKYLREVWESRGRPEEGFVCQSPKGTMLPYRTYLGALKKLCEKAGVPVVTTHELRHSATELFMDAGASEEDIRRLLNHRSLSAVKAYIHRTGDRLRGISDQVMFQEPVQTLEQTVVMLPVQETQNVH